MNKRKIYKSISISKMVQVSKFCIYLNEQRCLFVLLILIQWFQATAYITRLPCEHYARFNFKRVDFIYIGILVEEMKSISKKQCVINCVGNFNCKFINYDTASNNCHLNSYDTFNITKFKVKSGWMFLSPYYHLRKQGRHCQTPLFPCLDGQMCLETCEPPYYKCKVMKNVALGKPAFQKTDWSLLFPAENGVDGYGSTSFYTSHGGVEPWWYVDLQQAYDIAFVYILQGQLSKEVKMSIGKDNTSALANQLCTTLEIVTSGVGRVYECDYGFINGRYVYLYNDDGSSFPLTMYEVKVFVDI